MFSNLTNKLETDRVDKEMRQRSVTQFMMWRAGRDYLCLSSEVFLDLWVQVREPVNQLLTVDRWFSLRINQRLTQGRPTGI